ncbi:Aspartyl protease AED3-like protein [Drosera capensis]
MKPITLLSLLILLPLSTSLCDHPLRRRPDRDSTLEILHLNSPCSPFRSSTPSWENDILLMESKDRTRLAYLTSLVAGRSIVPIASGRQIIQSTNYIVRVKVGTPPQTMFMALDSSNDAAWMPCDGCVGCGGAGGFASGKSSSFKSVGCKASQCAQVPNPTCGGTSCTFNMTYGTSAMSATLSQDTITLAVDAISGYTFGCIQKATGASLPSQGLLGLGRGPLSLLSQTQSLYQSTFSYCLPSYKSLNFSGSLRLGPVAQPKTIKFTPLLRNPRRSSFYYVDLVGIRVGRRVVDIPASALKFDPSTGAGTIFDSGTMFTRLVQPAYNAVRSEVRRQMGNAMVSSLGGFDTCYSVPIVVPTITFMFRGMNMSLPPDNFIIHSSSTSISCIAMAASPGDDINNVLNVIGNMQQQNHRVLFDVPNSRLAVAHNAQMVVLSHELVTSC